VESKLSKEIKTEVLIAKNDLNKALKARIEAEQLPDSDPQKIQKLSRANEKVSEEQREEELAQAQFEEL